MHSASGASARVKHPSRSSGLNMLFIRLESCSGLYASRESLRKDKRQCLHKQCKQEEEEIYSKSGQDTDQASSEHTGVHVETGGGKPGQHNRHWNLLNCERTQRVCDDVYIVGFNVEEDTHKSYAFMLSCEKTGRKRDSSSRDGNPCGQCFIVLLYFHIKADLFPTSLYYSQFKQLPAVPLEMTHKNLCQLHWAILRA